MKNIALICLVFLTFGCASLSSRVTQNVNEGDTKEQVIHALGQPEAFSYYSEKESFQYSSKQSICHILFIENKVTQKSCSVQNASSPGVISSILGGIGRGLTSASAQQINCHSTRSGGYIYTTCN